MPVGILTDEELNDEIRKYSGGVASHTPTPRAEIVEKPHRGRSEGDGNVPPELRKVIADTALLDGREAALSLAKDFGVSSSSVSAYSVGANSTTSYDTPVKSLISHINKTRERAIKRASKTLNAALGSITQEKLDYTDAKDLSGIAKDMSVIIKNLEPPKEVDAKEGTAGPQFVIFAPTFRKEESFEVIDLKE